MEIKNVAVFGAGAIGSMIADKLEKKYGADFYLMCSNPVLKKPLVEDGLHVNGRAFHPFVIGSRQECPEKLDLLLVTVKNFHLPSSIEDMKQIIDSHTIILPILNGVYAFNTLTKEFPNNTVLCGIMVKTDTHPVGGNKTVYTTTGEIQVGEGKPEDHEKANAVVSFFKAADLNSNYYKDIRTMQFRKWMLNIGVNQVSALTGANFGEFQEIPEIFDVMRRLMEEVKEVANAEQIPLTDQDIEDLIAFTQKYPADKETSMLQDIKAERPTEINYFAGDVLYYGQKHHIATPYNQAMFDLITAKQAVYLGRKKANRK